MGQFNAALAAGYSRGYAKSHCTEIEEKADIKDLLDRNGLTDKKLTEKHSQLLEAKILTGHIKQYQVGENGGIEKIEGQGISIVCDDTAIQLKALELAYKLKGHLKDKIEHSGEIKFTVTEKISSARERVLNAISNN